MALSSLHAFGEMKRLVTLGVTYTSWLHLETPTVRFMNIIPSSLICSPLARPSFSVVVSTLCLEIPNPMMTHLPMKHIYTPVSDMEFVSAYPAGVASDGDLESLAV